MKPTIQDVMNLPDTVKPNVEINEFYNPQWLGYDYIKECYLDSATKAESLHCPSWQIDPSQINVINRACTLQDIYEVYNDTRNKTGSHISAIEEVEKVKPISAFIDYEALNNKYQPHKITEKLDMNLTQPIENFSYTYTPLQAGLTNKLDIMSNCNPNTDYVKEITASIKKMMDKLLEEPGNPWFPAGGETRGVLSEPAGIADFKVVCDETNNSKEDIKQNKLWIEFNPPKTLQLTFTETYDKSEYEKTQEWIDKWKAHAFGIPKSMLTGELDITESNYVKPEFDPNDKENVSALAGNPNVKPIWDKEVKWDKEITEDNAGFLSYMERSKKTWGGHPVLAEKAKIQIGDESHYLKPEDYKTIKVIQLKPRVMNKSLTFEDLMGLRERNANSLQDTVLSDANECFRAINAVHNRKTRRKD